MVNIWRTKCNQEDPNSQKFGRPSSIRHRSNSFDPVTRVPPMYPLKMQKKSKTVLKLYKIPPPQKILTTNIPTYDPVIGNSFYQTTPTIAFLPAKYNLNEFLRRINLLHNSWSLNFCITRPAIKTFNCNRVNNIRIYSIFLNIYVMQRTRLNKYHIHTYMFCGYCMYFWTRAKMW